MFTTVDGRDKFAHLDSIQIPNGMHIKVYPITGNVVHIKAFWVPHCVPNGLISREIIKLTERKGGNVKILNGEQQKVEDKRENILYGNSVRSFKAEVNDKSLIPHIINIRIPRRDHPKPILITVAGQDPMCLKCKKIGHHRSECKHDKDDSSWCSYCKASVGHSTNDCDERPDLGRSIFTRNEHTTAD